MPSLFNGLWLPGSIEPAVELPPRMLDKAAASKSLALPYSLPCAFSSGLA